MAHFKRKFFIIATLLLTLLVVGCGGPDAKEEAQRIDKEYFQTAKNMFSSFEEEFQALREKYNDAEELDIDLAAIVDSKYIPENSTLKKKLQAEKLPSRLDEQKKALLNHIDSFGENYTLVSLLKDKSKLNTEHYKYDLLNAYIKTFDTKLEYENEASKVLFGKETYELTLSNFQKIHKGYSYVQVAKLFKMPGTLTNSTESNNALIGPRKLEHYYWENNGATVRIMFENGKVYRLEQRGLK